MTLEEPLVKVETIETLEIELDGHVYRGKRLLFPGRGEMRQQIRFETLRYADPAPYPAEGSALMDHIARLVLRQLVEEWRARPSDVA